MTSDNLFGQRIRDAASRLADAGAETLLLCPGASMQYLTGFEHSHAGERLLALLVHRDGSSAWIVPAMNVPQVRSHLLPGQKLTGWSDAEGYLEILLRALGDGAVAFDDEARAGFLIDIVNAGGTRVIRSASAVMRRLRLLKDNAELELMLAAGATVDQTIAEATSLCLPEATEAEVEARLREALRRRSPESQVAFSIVASGPNSALPHHETGNRSLSRGDLVVLDFGTRLHGYHSDITVTCAVGEPFDPEARRVYAAVWEAQQRALEAIRPGATCGAVDVAARTSIADAGYGHAFLHRTGHGLGLQVHEPPYLVGGSTEVLEEGMVFSVEPGIYLEGRFGVRLEVIAMVTGDGARLINAPSARELPVVSSD
jgi:D-alanyl-D-alanine dipeptidase